MYCLECNSLLGKRQKKFCSRKCMNVYNAREFGMKHREENPNRYKICKECNQSLNLNKFSLIEKWNVNSGTRDICKKCSIRIRQTEKLNRDWKVDAAKLLYKNIKSRCKRIEREFSIELEDIIIPEKCPVFGFELKREDKQTWMCAPSVDRIDSSKGYIKGNITVVSRRANILKRDATVDELEQLLNYYKTLRN
jgi:t-SNARE complex subunit (syntaxin)